MRFNLALKNKMALKKVIFILFFGICTLSQSSWAENRKMKYGPGTVPLSQSNVYFKTNFPPLFWSLIPYYMPQTKGWSCGIASSAMVINAARSVLKMNVSFSSEDSLVNEDDLIEWIKKDKKLSKYFELFQKRGMTLDELGDVLRELFKKYEIQGSQIRVVLMSQDAHLEEKEKQLHQILMSLENSDRQMIIPNFDQGAYTGDGSWGHYSPVAAYNSKNDTVLIMDTDRKWFEPYWISRKKFSQGMQTRDKTTNKSRGYIHIQLPVEK